MNQLNNSQSLYLQQHKDNPIDWMEWSEEAFVKAQKENKPVFLSIGYSACHFCHLMNKKAFSEEAIGKKLNQNFISIKVDREEMMDVDMQYLQMAQAIMGQSLGYPLNLFLTPEKNPFFAFSYLPAFPQEDFDGCLSQLLDQIHQLWVQGGRAEIDTKSKSIRQIFEKIDEQMPFKIMPGNELIKKTYQDLMTCADSTDGGLLPEPKFPSVPIFRYLLKMGRFYHMTLAKEHVFLTLRKMQEGALHDPVENGFFRYCIDAKWSIPHFEKMAEDQIQISQLCIEAWQVSKNPLFSEMAISTLKFCIDHFVAEDGGVFNSIDSDSAGWEGAYYTYTLEEIESLSELQKQRIQDLYISDTSRLGEKYILRQKQSFGEYAKKNAELVEDLKPKVKEALLALKKLREKRQKPTLDRKKLTYVNALFGKVFLQAYFAFSDQRYLTVAKSCFAFLHTKLFQDGSLNHMHTSNGAKHLANLLDLSMSLDFVCEYAAKLSDRKVLEFAISLADQIRKYFSAPKGGFYFSDLRTNHIPVRKREYFDSAIPSAQAITAQAFQKLSSISGKKAYLEEAKMILKAAGPYIEKRIPFFSLLDSAMLQHNLTTITAPEEHRVKVLHELNQHYYPEVIYVPDEFALESMGQDVAKYGSSKIVICKGGKCLPPIEKISEIANHIEGGNE